MSLRQDNMKDPLEAGLAAYQRGQSKVAIRHFESALTADTLDQGDLYLARLMLARCYAGTGLLERALEIWQTALPLPAAFDDLWRYFNAVARDAFRSGDSSSALAHYDRSASLAHLWLELYGVQRTGVAGGQFDAAATTLRSLSASGFDIYGRSLIGDGLPALEKVFSKTDLKNIAALTAVPNH